MEPKIAFAVCFKNSNGALRCNFTRFISACGALVIPMHLVDNYRNHRYTAPISLPGSSISAEERCREPSIQITLEEVYPMLIRLDKILGWDGIPT